MSHDPARWTAALAQVDGWDVPHAAAAVVTAAGTAATVGDVDRVYDLASVTKPLAALATLVAVEEEAVDLDAPLELPGLPPPPAPVTLRHLLAHASGLDAEGTRWQQPPQTRRIYSNGGFDAVAGAVERATGMTFAAYLAEAVCAPLGLAATTLTGSAAKDGRSSVRDLAVLARRLLAPAGWLHPSTLAAAASPQWPGLRGVLPGFGGQDDNVWGLGLEIRGHKHPHWTGRDNSPATFGHFGQSGTMLWVDPAAGLALVALTDRAFGPWAATAWPALSDAVLGAGSRAGSGAHPGHVPGR